MSNFEIEFQPSGRGKAQCAPDPRYPSGKAVDAAKPGAESCTIRLPYPAPECGAHFCRCMTCGFSIAITAAGRPDDPITVRVPCRQPVPA